MKDDQQQCRTMFGKITLAFALVGFLMWVIYQVASLFFTMNWLDGMPNWLGFTLMIPLVCAIVWEFKLLPNYTTKLDESKSCDEQALQIKSAANQKKNAESGSRE